MSAYFGLSRRANGDRRTFNTHPSIDWRHTDRRRDGTDRYFFVIGNGGIDQFGLLVSLPLLALIAFSLIKMLLQR